MSKVLLKSTRLLSIPNTHIDLLKESGFFHDKTYCELFINGVTAIGNRLGTINLQFLRDYEGTSRLFQFLNKSYKIDQSTYYSLKDPIINLIHCFHLSRLSEGIYGAEFVYEDFIPYFNRNYTEVVFRYNKIIIVDGPEHYLYNPLGKFIGIVLINNTDKYKIPLELHQVKAVRAGVATCVLDDIIAIHTTHACGYYCYNGIIKIENSKIDKIKTYIKITI